MPTKDIRIAYRRSEFEKLEGPVDFDRLKTALIALPLEHPIIDIRPLVDGGISVEWALGYSDADEARVTTVIRNFQALPTSSEPFSARSDAFTVLAPSSSLVVVITAETPPFDEGRYLVSWLSQHRLTNPASNTASCAQVLIYQGKALQHEQYDHSSSTLARAFNGAIPVRCPKGASLHLTLALMKVGVGAVSAEMKDARFDVYPMG